MIIILQEADELLYRAALSVEKRCYEVETADGMITDYGNTLTKTELKEVLGDTEYEIRGYRTVESLSAALFNLDDMVRKIKQHGDAMRFFLSPSDKSNFRYKSAVTKKYKDGRPERPILYEPVREYLVEMYGAEEVHGYEADDGLGIYASRNTILSHIDKDINMIPGQHLNWVTGQRYVCSELGSIKVRDKKVVGGGLKFFYFQLLTGDRVDNIPGLDRIGPKTAMKLLEEAETEKEFIDVVVNTYSEKVGDNWKSYLLEQADLLWICRKQGETGAIYLEKKLEELL